MRFSMLWGLLGVAVGMMALLQGCTGDNTATTRAAPTASFTVTPTSGTTTTVFAVDASTSSDPTDPIGALLVRWDWDSNGHWTTYATAKTATHTFTVVGTHTISMQVMNTVGLTGTTTKTVTVTTAGGGNTAPSANFTVTPTSGTTSTSFAFDASSSTDTQDLASALQVRWDWDSTGAWTAYTTTKTASHVFANAGTHTVTLQVKDTGGLTGTATKTVTVTTAGGGNTAPSANFTVTPASGTTSTSFAFDASSSTDTQDPASALQVRWDWDSTGAWTAYTTTKTANHVFASAGTHTVTLQVKDTGGLTGTATQTVTVTAPTGPSLNLSLDASLNGTGTVKVATITSAEILNSSGSVVKTATISGGSATIAISGLASGAYFIRVNGLTNDLVPTYFTNTTASFTQFVGNSLNQSVIGTLASPTYRFKTYSLGQGNSTVVKYSNGTAATPARYGYVQLNMGTQVAETRVLGSGTLLVSHTRGHHNFATWIVGATNHGTSVGNGGSCTGCHGNLDTHPANHANINESNGFCFKCHYGKAGSSNGLVDPAQ